MRSKSLVMAFMLLTFTLIFPVRTNAQNIVCENPTQASIQPHGQWQSRAPMPIFRAEIASTTLDGKIYVVGGLAGKSTMMSEISAAFEAYDAASDSWQALAPLPKALHHIALAAIDEHIYLTGGYDSLNLVSTIRSAWAYDVKADTWTAIADLPAPRAAHTMAAIDGKLYLVGGITAQSTALWSYDPAADKWITKLAPMPTEREHLASVVLDDKLYVLGGEEPNKDGSGNETYVRLATLEVYDPATDTWAALHDMPTPRSSITAGVLNGLIHVVGGENVEKNCVYAQHEVYDPAKDSWVQYPVLATPRHGPISGVIDGSWYVIGGATIPAYMTIMSLSATSEVFVPSEK
jgi:N-acetylneuraminic acid mutarotase